MKGDANSDTLLLTLHRQLQAWRCTRQDVQTLMLHPFRTATINNIHATVHMQQCACNKRFQQSCNIDIEFNILLPTTPHTLPPYVCSCVELAAECQYPMLGAITDPPGHWALGRHTSHVVFLGFNE